MKQYWVFFTLLFGYSCNTINTTKMNKPSFTSGYAPLGALKMYYEIHGSGGTPLVLIHGGGSTIGTTWGRIIDSLANDRQVIAVELQAHGHTNDIGKPTSFEQDADDVAGLMNYLKIPKADYYGFSNGGNTAMQIAIRHPASVNKMVIASAFYKREGMIPGFFEGMPHATLENMPKVLAEAYLEINPNKDDLQIMFERDKTRMVEFKDWSDEVLMSIKAKTLVLAADHDVMTNEHTVTMARLIPDAELLIVPGTHGSFLNEAYSVNLKSKIPEMTIAMVKEFLDK